MIDQELNNTRLVDFAQKCSKFSRVSSLGPVFGYPPFYSLISIDFCVSVVVYIITYVTGFLWPLVRESEI